MDSVCFVCFLFYESAGRQLKRFIILISFVFLCKFRTSSSEDFNPGNEQLVPSSLHCLLNCRNLNSENIFLCHFIKSVLKW